MGRGYSVEAYDELVAELREARPDLALSTDIIVGFPGESDAAFERTLDLIERTRFSSVFAFVYSPRPGTAAPRLTASGQVDEVPKPVADARLQELFAVQQTIQHELNSELVGRTLPVLVTSRGERDAGSDGDASGGTATCSGRTSCHRIVHFPPPAEDVLPGRLTDVTIERALPHSLLGRPPVLPGAAS